MEVYIKAAFKIVGGLVLADLLPLMEIKLSVIGLMKNYMDTIKRFILMEKLKKVILKIIRGMELGISSFQLVFHNQLINAKLITIMVRR